MEYDQNLSRLPLIVLILLVRYTQSRLHEVGPKPFMVAIYGTDDTG